MKITSYEQAREILQWVKARSDYRRACGQKNSGPDYAADIAAESAALSYLGEMEAL